MSSIVVNNEDDIDGLMGNNNSGSLGGSGPGWKKGGVKQKQEQGHGAQKGVKVFEDTMCSELANLIDQIRSVP